MCSFYLGVDIGGSKSHALLVDEQGQVIGFGEAGPGNHEVVGYDGLTAALKRATNQALRQAGAEIGQVSGAGFGVAGYDWPSELPLTEEAISGLGLTCPQQVVNDALIGLVAGAEQGWGVAVVGGTGCNAWGWDARRSRTGRVTGNGYLFGEAGGGSDLVIRAIQAVARQWNRLGQPTRLTAAFLEYTGASSVEQMLEGLALGQYFAGAGAAPMVVEVARSGDEVAQDVVRWAGQELGSLAVAVIRQLYFQKQTFEVVLVGSLFKAGALLVEPMAHTIWEEAPGARLVPLTVPPVIGGVLLGMEASGVDPRPLRMNVIETYLRHIGADSGV
jgi:N-acetylglucosamine kinase-like BadF-type ATPase